MLFALAGHMSASMTLRLVLKKEERSADVQSVLMISHAMLNLNDT